MHLLHVRRTLHREHHVRVDLGGHCGRGDCHVVLTGALVAAGGQCGFGGMGGLGLATEWTINEQQGTNTLKLLRGKLDAKLLYFIPEKELPNFSETAPRVI